MKNDKLSVFQGNEWRDCASAVPPLYEQSGFSFAAAAFFFLGLVANAFALSLAATRKNRFLTILFTLAGMLLSYYILPISTYCTTPYATMLFFTLFHCSNRPDKPGRIHVQIQACVCMSSEDCRRTLFADFTFQRPLYRLCL